MAKRRAATELEASVASALNGWSLDEESRELKVFRLMKDLNAISPMDMYIDKHLRSKRSGLIRDLNDFLKSYACTPEIFEDDDSMWGAVWTWEYAPPKPSPGESRLTKWEALIFVQNVLRLASEGQLGLIGQCQVCGKWKVFRQINQKFCSQKCRQREYESREDVRQRRNDNRRMNYQEAIARDRRNRAR